LRPGYSMDSLETNVMSGATILETRVAESNDNLAPGREAYSAPSSSSFFPRSITSGS
jgi:hypothetical protein